MRAVPASGNADRSAERLCRLACQLHVFHAAHLEPAGASRPEPAMPTDEQAHADGLKIFDDRASRSAAALRGSRVPNYGALPGVSSGAWLVCRGHVQADI